MNLKWRISHTRGYLELGMVREARAELDAITGADAQRIEVLALRVALLQATERWRPLRKLAAELVQNDPGEAGWWVILAYATRRVRSVAAAEKVLLQAAARHADDATVQFNLGCYACQRGDLALAKERVERAIRIDADYRKNAREDPDLAPLRAAEPAWPKEE